MMCHINDGITDKIFFYFFIVLVIPLLMTDVIYFLSEIMLEIIDSNIYCYYNRTLPIENISSIIPLLFYNF